MRGAMTGRFRTWSPRQARLAVAFAAKQRREQAAAGVPRARQGRGVAEQIGLARRCSPTRAARFLANAQILCLDLPATMTRHVAGQLSAYRAGLVATEVALLSPGDRALVDADVNPGGPLDLAALTQGDALAELVRGYQAEPADLSRLSDRAVRAAAASAAYRVDPGAAVRRGRHAESERYVSLRPAPDTMAILSAYLPVRQGVACLASLRQAADAARAAGDARSRGQVMADSLFARLSGAERPVELPLELQLVLTDAALLGDLVDDAQGPAPSRAPQAGTAGDEQPPDDGAEAPVSALSPTPPSTPGREPADLVGYGPIPAATARAWLRDNLDAESAMWIRRLVTGPVSGGVAAIDTRARLFPAALRRLILARDRFCRTPYCGAPIRHIDHATAHAYEGPTSAANGQGLCERCNLAKSAPGWAAGAVADPAGRERHAVATTTPTGHRYVSTAPPVARSQSDGCPRDERSETGTGAEGLPRAG